VHACLLVLRSPLVFGPVMNASSLVCAGGIRRFVVLRALQLGDLLCSVPAFRALRHAFPQAELTLVGLGWAEQFVQRFHTLFDRFVEFPGYPGLPERPPDLARIPAWLADMQAEHYDLALQMQGSGSIVNELLALWGARVNAGFYTLRNYCPDPEHFLLYPENESEVWRHLRLMERLGIPLQGDALEFPLSEQDYDELACSVPESRLVPGSYVCIHPGARYPSRRWSPASFARVGDAFAARGFSIVLTGSAAESHLATAVASAMKMPALNLAGRTTLGALAVLLARARLLVSNDTGVSHVAAALDVPSVIIGLSSDIPRWAPLDTQRHRVIYHPLECSPCAFVECPIGHPCVASVEPAEVIETALQLLGHAESSLPRRMPLRDMAYA